MNLGYLVGHGGVLSGMLRVSLERWPTQRCGNLLHSTSVKAIKEQITAVYRRITASDSNNSLINMVISRIILKIFRISCKSQKDKHLTFHRT